MRHTPQVLPSFTDVPDYPLTLVVIINFTHYQDTIACIESLLKCAYPNFHIYIIDNCSPNDSYSKLQAYIEKKCLPNITLECSSKNTGFAGGVNIGLRYAVEHGYEYACLLNPDTTVKQDFLCYLVDTAGANSDIGIVGGKILISDTDRIFSAGGRISYIRNIGHNENYHKKDGPNLSGEIDSDFVSGCLMLISVRMVRDIGLFDEGYFMYLEDADYCYKATHKGWKIRTNLNAIVWHKAEDSAHEEFAAFWGAKNRLRFIFRNLTGVKKVIALLLHLLPKPFLYLKVRKRNIIISDLMGIVDFFRHRDNK